MAMLNNHREYVTMIIWSMEFRFISGNTGIQRSLESLWLVDAKRVRAMVFPRFFTIIVCVTIASTDDFEYHIIYILHIYIYIYVHDYI